MRRFCQATALQPSEYRFRRRLVEDDFDGLGASEAPELH